MIQRLVPVVLSVLLILSVSHAGEVRTITLDNGLEVVMMPDGSSPLFSSLLIIRTGSSYETLASAGSTHLLEHMLFRGTETRTQGEIYDGFDLMGAYYNAQTSKTYTNFILVAPSEHALEAMELQADMVLHSTIPADTFEVEKGRVIAEIQQSLGRTSYQAETAHIRNVYGTSSYGFPTLGSVPGIRALTRDTVYGFHRDWYAVNNMVLVMRGDMSFRDMEELAVAVFGDETPRQLPERPENWPMGFDSWEANLTHTIHRDVRSGMVKVSIPAPRFDHADAPAFAMLNSILDDRLESALQGSGMPMVTYVYSSLEQDPGFSVLDINAGLMPTSDANMVIETILQTVRNFAMESFDDSMIDLTRQSIRQFELFFGEQVQYGSFLLVPKLTLAPWGFWQRYEQRMDMVDADEAEYVAAQWLSEPLWIATATLPHDDTEEAGEGITLGELAADTLDNGLTILVRQVEGAPVAGIHIVVKNRSILEGESHAGWGDLLHRLLVPGDNELDELSYEDRMAEIGMEITAVDNAMIPMDDYRTTPEYSYIRTQAVADNWQEAVHLLGELFQQTSISESELQTAIGELSGIVARKQPNASYKASNLLDSHLFAGHPFASAVYGEGSSLENVDANELIRFRQIYFAPNNLIISVFAPDDPEIVMDAVRAAFGHFETVANSAPAEIPAPSPSIDGWMEERVTGAGEQGYLSSGFFIPNVAEEDHAALLIANAMISDLIYRDLGERRGWAYGAGSSLLLRPGWGVWQVNMGLPEEHLEESKEAVYEHLERIASGDFDEHRMEVARNYLLGRVLRRYSSRINLAMALGHDAFLYNDPLHTWHLYDAFQQATMEQVRDAAARYLELPDTGITVYGIPEPSEQPARRMPPGMGGMMR